MPVECEKRDLSPDGIQRNDEIAHAYLIDALLQTLDLQFAPVRLDPRFPVAGQVDRLPAGKP